MPDVRPFPTPGLAVVLEDARQPEAPVADPAPTAPDAPSPLMSPARAALEASTATEELAAQLMRTALLRSGLSPERLRPFADLPVGVKQAYREAAEIAVRRLDDVAHGVGLLEMADAIATPGLTLTPELLLRAYFGGLLDPNLVSLKGGKA